MQVNGPDANEQERRRLKQRVVELEAAIDQIREAWAYFHSVGGSCSRDDWVRAISDTKKVIERVWRAN